MNGDDQFETRLRLQPQRAVPPAWREEILTAAREHAAPTRPPGLRSWRSLVSDLLWPHPKAWAGLGAAWLVVLAIHFAALDAPPRRLTATRAAAAPVVRQAARERERMLAELVGLLESPAATAPKPAPGRPRSQWHGQFLNT